MTQAILTYNGCLFVLTLGILVILNRVKDERPITWVFTLGITQVFILFLAAILYPLDGFGRLQLLAWGFFLQLPVFLTGSLILVFKISRRFAILLLGLIVLILGIAVDAFLIEPQWLEVTEITLVSPKLDQTVKVIVIADIQTDHPGSYESRVLEFTAAEDPDLVLMAGDYLQISDPETYQIAVEEFRIIFQSTQIDPPLGIFAVRGNVDHPDWTEIFQVSEVHTFESTISLDLGPLILTGMSWRDSENPGITVQGSDKYHLVLGHSPNFSLGNIQADLLIAGHTHGGQFQLPGIGPILTLSLVPREWASGLTEIAPDQFLLVSRGIGLERGAAPRMRFLCRPELIILHLEPAQ